MITKSATEVRERVTRVFMALGAPEPVAQRIADGLTESNLVGHDSHGVQRVPEYVARARAGRMNLDGKIERLSETTATALIDCHWNLGQSRRWKG